MVNPAVQTLLEEIARAKKRAQEKKAQQGDSQQAQYGIIRIDNQLHLRLPPPPPKPSPDDCCKTGCTPCILITYAEQHQAYEENIQMLKRQFERAQQGEPGAELVHMPTKLPGGLLDPLRFCSIGVRRTRDFGNRSRLLVLDATPRDFVLSLGEHIHVRMDHVSANGRGKITKPFTPVMIADSDGIVRPHIFVRIYPDNAMSQYLLDLHPGSMLTIRGPVRTIENMTLALACPGPTVLVAGGSGIAPLFQILQFAQINIAYCKKHIVVVHCVSDKNGLWLNEEIERMQEKMPGLRYHKVVSQNSGDDDGGRRRLNRIEMEGILEEYQIEEDSGLSLAQAQAVVCGPGSFNDDVGSWLAHMGVPGIQKL